MNNDEISNILSSNFLLIDLTIRKWSGKSVDKKATQTTLAAAHARSDAGQFVKKAMVGANSELRQTSADFDAVRTYLYANSMPYSTSSEGTRRGPRMVPTSTSMEVLKGIQERINTASASLDALLAVYDDRRNEAMANLGDLANPADYPTKEELKCMFGVHVDVLPIPAQADFSRTTIPTTLAHELGRRVAAQQQRVMDTANKDLHERILQEINRIARQLGKHAEGMKTRLYASLTSNITGLVGLLESTNVDNDQRTKDLVGEIKAALCVHSIADIKKSPALAGDVARKAERLAIKVQAHSNPEIDTDGFDDVYYY